jgi:hypothetical protein
MGYTHVIVAEAGVNAPLPDRTGRGLNIATSPGAQGDDASQSLNPSVNGARPTNNGLRINGMDATNMLNAYFNVSAFQDSLDQWGNTGRNILRGPSQVQLDLTLARRFPVGPSQRVELRWEIFNALNTPVFGNPASTFAANGYGTAGQITSTIGGPRTMQVAARFLF